MEQIINIDSSIFLFFNGMHNAFFDNFMTLFSGRFIWIALYLSMVYAMLRRFDLKQFAILAIAIGLTILFTDQLCASVIRPVFERLRPSNLSNPLSEFTHVVNGYRGGSYGFPSCHAANSFALATFTAMMFQKRCFTIFVFAWAVLNSYSRIYLGVHYPGDLFVGAIIGSAIAAAMFMAAKAACAALHIALKPCNFPSAANTLKIIYTVASLTILYIIIYSTISVVN